MNVGFPERTASTNSPKASDVSRYNTQPNRPTTIKPSSDHVTGYTSVSRSKPKSSASSGSPKQQPASTTSDRAVQGLRNAASSGKLGGTLQTLSNRRAQMDALLQQNSYEPEGDSIDELNRYEKETGKDTRTGKPTSSGGKYSEIGRAHV